MDVKIKEPKTFEEQLEILRCRGIDFEAEDEYDKAMDIIKRVGYYRLINGYKGLFIDRSETERIDVGECFKKGTTVSEIHSLYYFDKDLREVMLRYILPVETHLKSLIAYTVSTKYGQDNYLKYETFDTERKDAYKDISNLLSDIHRQIAQRYKDPVIQHYLGKYGFIPMWVLNNILTFGTVSKFYSVMQQPDRQAIAKQFGISDSDLENFMLYLTSIRNISAHGNRLFCQRSKRPLVDTRIHSILKIEKIQDEYKYGKRDMFATLIALQCLVSHNEYDRLLRDINKIINHLRPHLNVISVDDVLEAMGFPENWFWVEWKTKNVPPVVTKIEE